MLFRSGANELRPEIRAQSVRLESRPDVTEYPFPLALASLRMRGDVLPTDWRPSMRGGGRPGSAGSQRAAGSGLGVAMVADSAPAASRRDVRPITDRRQVRRQDFPFHLKAVVDHHERAALEQRYLQLVFTQQSDRCHHCQEPGHVAVGCPVKHCQVDRAGGDTQYSSFFYGLRLPKVMLDCLARSPGAPSVASPAGNSATSRWSGGRGEVRGDARP